MAINPQMQIHKGMKVTGTDGSKIGTVKEVRADHNDMLVNRNNRRDVYVPFNAIEDVANNEVVLTIPANQVDNKNWPEPPLI